MKRILLLTAGPGESRSIAAANLRLAIQRRAGGAVHIDVRDLIEQTSSGFGERLRHPFQAGALAVREALRAILLGTEPDVVVSFHPAYGSLVGEIFRGGRRRDFILVSLVGEAAVGDTPVAQTPSDYFIVPCEAAARALIAQGAAKAMVKTLGYPVLGPVPGAKRTAPGAASPPRILCLLDAAGRKAPKLLDRLLAHAAWDITVATADPALQRLALEKSKRLTLVRDLDDLPHLLATHHAVIGRAENGTVHEAIAAGCPMTVYRARTREEEDNVELLRGANAGAMGERPRQVVDWLERAFRDDARLLDLWRRNLAALGRPHGADAIADFVLDQATPPVPRLPDLAPPAAPAPTRLRPAPRGEKKLLMCDLHTHTTWSDGKLSIPELVDFYGERGFDCLCVTDHLCDPQRLLGRLVNLTGLVIPPNKVAAYFAAIEREKKRAWEQYKLLLMTGVEFNKDGYTPKTSTHLLGVDLKKPIDPSLDIKTLIAEIHAQDGLAIASHPHEIKSEWGKNTLYLWEHVDDYAPLLDAWEVANRDDIFNPVGLKKLPFVANSDFHKPKHIASWKTLLYCEKDPEAIKQCIRVNRDVALTLYRDHRFGLEGRVEEPDAVPAALARG